MKQTIDEYDFTRAFQESESHKNQFSYGALKAIFAYYEEYEESTGEELELDIVATCCDFTEFESATEAMKQYTNNDLSELNIDWLDATQAEDDELIETQAREWLDSKTTVLDADGYNFDDGAAKKVTSIVIVNF